MSQAKIGAAKVTPAQFGTFTRSDVIAILKQLKGRTDEAAVLVAATALAGMETASGYMPELIDGALDLLAEADTPLARDLLWQAAANANIARVRFGAVRRSAPAATTPERRKKLREWVVNGFPSGSVFPHDNLDTRASRDAALVAISKVKSPEQEDVDLVVSVLKQLAFDDTNINNLFVVATNAYWNIGNAESLPALMDIITKCRKPAFAVHLVVLPAKFPATAIKPHALALREALLRTAGNWNQGDPDFATRAVELGKKIADEQFIKDWANSQDKDGMTSPRGKLALAMLDKLDAGSEAVARTWLIYARHTGHLQDDGPVMNGLKAAVDAGRGGIIAETLTQLGPDGYQHLVGSGKLFRMFGSIKEAVAVVCSVLSKKMDQEQRNRRAQACATGLLVAATYDAAKEKFTQQDLQNRDRQNRNQLDDFSAEVRTVMALPENPFQLVASELFEDSAEGAAIIYEWWTRVDDDIANAAILTLFKEGARHPQATVGMPLMNLEKWWVVRSPSLRGDFEKSLPEHVIVGGRINRYVLGLMQRQKVAVGMGLSKALAGLSASEDVDSLFQQLRDEDGQSVLSDAINFHRGGNATLTSQVRAKAIALVGERHAHGSTNRASDQLVTRLHERFEDAKAVRLAAYEACGRILDFNSIQPLRSRLSTESEASHKKAIRDVLIAFKDRLIQSKPSGSDPKVIAKWLGYVGQLGDPALIPYVTDYLLPQHPVQEVRLAAIHSLTAMGGPDALDILKRFVDENAPAGETLRVARRARLFLEQRHDAELFELLAVYLPPESPYLDPSLDYQALLGVNTLTGVLKALRTATRQWDDHHWDDFITWISGAMEAVIKHLFRTKYAKMGMDQAKGEMMAKKEYANMLSMSEFKNAFPALQIECLLMNSYRRDTAHVMNNDGTNKPDTTEEDARRVRDAYMKGFGEGVKALQ